jgi:hypothetical protein
MNPQSQLPRIQDSKQVKDLLGVYLGEKDSLKVRIDELEGRVREVTQIIDALELARDVLERAGLFTEQVAKERAEAQQTQLDLTDSNIPQSLIRILTHRGGSAKVGDLVDELQKAGKVKGRRRSNYSQVYRSMKDRPHIFVKVAGEEGTFALASQDGNHAAYGG